MNILPDLLTPEEIISKLSSFYEQAHFNHFNTASYAEHKALGELYEGLIDWKDKVGELLLGYIAPRRFSSVVLSKVDPKKSSISLVNEIISFSKTLYLYGEMNNWIELSNFAADIEGFGVKIKYLLTLK